MAATASVMTSATTTEHRSSFSSLNSHHTPPHPPLRKDSVQHYLKPSRDSLRKKSLEKHGLTLNKLHFTDDTLYGRDIEIATLKDIIESAATASTRALDDDGTAITASMSSTTFSYMPADTATTSTAAPAAATAAADDDDSSSDKDQRYPHHHRNHHHNGHDHHPTPMIQVAFVHGRSGTGKSKLVQHVLQGFLNQQGQEQGRTRSSSCEHCYSDSGDNNNTNTQTRKRNNKKYYVAQGKFDLRNVNRPYTALSDALCSLWSSIVVEHRRKREEQELERRLEHDFEEDDDDQDSNDSDSNTGDESEGDHHKNNNNNTIASNNNMPTMKNKTPKDRVDDDIDDDAFIRVKKALGSLGPSTLETLIPTISKDIAYDTLLHDSLNDHLLNDIPTELHTSGSSNHRRCGDNTHSSHHHHDDTDDWSSAGQTNNDPGSVNSATSLGRNTSVNRHKLEFYLNKFIQAICGSHDDEGRTSVTGTPASTATTKPTAKQHAATATDEIATIVLFLDDMQWADHASMILLETILLKASQKNRFVLIGGYRDNEIADCKDAETAELKTCHDATAHPLLRLQNKMGLRAQDDIENHRFPTLTATYIAIENLDLLQVHQLVAESLRMEVSGDHDSSTPLKKDMARLATLVYERTMGNVFFVKQFLQMLVDRELLQFQFGTLEWEWNVDSMRSETNATDGVIDILSAKMSTKLRRADLLLLQVASCLGATFHIKVCSYVMMELLKKDYVARTCDSQCGVEECKDGTVESPLSNVTLSSIMESLEERVEDGFLEFVVHTNRFDLYEEYDEQLRFVHNAIQDAAYGLIPQDQRSLFAYQVGRILLNSKLEDISSEFDDDSDIHTDGNLNMLAVDLLNTGRGHMTDDTERLDLANLNLEVGLENMESSAFAAAAKLFEIGVGLVNEQKHPWTVLYYMTHPLYTNLIDAKYCCGDFAGVKQLADEFLDNTQDKPIQDKFRTYMIIVESFQAEGYDENALELSLQVLEEIGVRFPKGITMKLALIPAVIKTRLVLDKYPLKDMKKLPLMTDEIRLAAIEFAIKMGRSAILVRPDLIPLIAMWCIRQTVKHGLTRISSVSVAGWAVVNLAMHNHEEALENAKLAVDLSEEFQYQQAHVRIVGGSFINHWRYPYHELKPFFMLGYQYGLQRGDAISAMQCAFEYCRVGFSTRVNLEEVKADLQVYLKQAIEYKQDGPTASRFKVQLQLMENLMDEDLEGLGMNQRGSSRLIGTFLSAEEREEISKGVPFVRVFADACTLWLAMHFGELEVAKKMLKRTRDIERVCLGLATVWQRLLPWGITASDSRDLRSLKIAHSKARHYAEIGNANCIHIAQILNAEIMSHSKKANVKDAYDEAIISAGRNGFWSDQGLANERAGRYFFYKLKDEDWARFYVANAHRIYLDWGARNLATRLRREFPTIFSSGR